MTIIFKHPGLSEDWRKLRHFNPDLCEIVLKLDLHVKKDITVTAISRDSKEEKALTGKSKRTAHEVGIWAAIDLSSKGFDRREIADIVSFVNRWTPTNSNPVKSKNCTCLYHKEDGNEWHFHIQYAPRHRRHAAHKPIAT
jgi:oligoribonuclease (3'-5' exoribonuclease)